jgi:hypothetical protein
VKIIPIFLSILTAIAFNTPEEAAPFELSTFQWKNRLLFLFAPDENNLALKKIKRQLTFETEGIIDRDLVVFEVLEVGKSRMNNSKMDQKTSESIRNLFETPPGKFTLILVGKDGGVKFRSNEQVSLEEIFELIDSMPMRKNEMRRKTE